MNDHAVSSPRPRGWKFFALIAGGVVVLLIAAAALPLIFAESVERVIAEARVAGIPVSAADLGRHGDPQRERLTAELQSLKLPYDLQATPFYQTGGLTLQLNPNLTRDYLAVPATTIARVITIGEALRGMPPTSLPSPLARSSREEMILRLVQVLCARSVVDPPADADAEAALLLDLAATCDPWCYRSAVAYAQVLVTLRLRLPLIRNRAALAAALRRHADAMQADFVRGVEVGFVVRAEVLRNPEQGFRALGVALPDIMENPLGCAAICRLGSATYLRRELAWVAAARHHQDQLILRRTYFARHPRGRSAAWFLSLVMADDRILGTAGILTWADNRLLARAIAWHLDGQRRPVDDFDPGKVPLRTLERDGRVVAVYSVGWDGVDDGGTSSKDTAWWLEVPIAPATTP